MIRSWPQEDLEEKNLEGEEGTDRYKGPGAGMSLGSSRDGKKTSGLESRENVIINK